MGEGKRPSAFKIGELARRFGANLHTLRCYEEIGLLPAARLGNGDLIEANQGERFQLPNPPTHARRTVMNCKATAAITGTALIAALLVTGAFQWLGAIVLATVSERLSDHAVDLG
jgi:hypothetical protein